MIDIYHNMLWPKYKGAVFSEGVLACTPAWPERALFSRRTD
ncbi:hypothetical protein ACU4HD_35900 [Cupriavidus basilensis]